LPGIDLEELTRLLTRERQVAELIDDRQHDRGAHVLPIALLALCYGTLQHQISRRDEARLDARLCRQIPERDRQVSLAHSGWPERDPELKRVRWTLLQDELMIDQSPVRSSRRTPWLTFPPQELSAFTFSRY